MFLGFFLFSLRHWSGLSVVLFGQCCHSLSWYFYLDKRGGLGFLQQKRLLVAACLNEHSRVNSNLSKVLRWLFELVLLSRKVELVGLRSHREELLLHLRRFVEGIHELVLRGLEMFVHRVGEVADGVWRAHICVLVGSE